MLSANSNSFNDHENIFEWTFEKSTMVGLGQGNRVISMKRNSFILNEVDDVNDDVSELTQRVGQLELELASMNAKMELLLAAAAAADATTSSAAMDDSVTSTGDVSESNMDTINIAFGTPATVAAVVGGPDTSTDATAMNQPDKTGEDATPVVMGDTTAINTNASVGFIDDESPPLFYTSSSKIRHLSTFFGKHDTSLFLLSLTILFI
mmetsp:Transcript_28210/g.58793  ORF Transcript_28210/g.58793 Transcript_28210/m.58793 type:complete len:208 (+) Transcript_28210:1377-2000(+)